MPLTDDIFPVTPDTTYTPTYGPPISCFVPNVILTQGLGLWDDRACVYGRVKASIGPMYEGPTVPTES